MSQNPETILSTKLTVEAEYEALIVGVQSLPDTSFILNGITLAKPDLVQRLQKRVDAAEATKTSKKQWLADVQVEHAVNADVAPLRAAMKTFVETRFGKNSSKLRDFGYPPAKPRKTTTAKKAAGVAKAKATRKVRGVMGTKQRKAIVAPAAPPPAEATPPAEAPAPPPAANAAGGGHGGPSA
jgi:hypothetical protein